MKIGMEFGMRNWRQGLGLGIAIVKLFGDGGFDIGNGGFGIGIGDGGLKLQH